LKNIIVISEIWVKFVFVTPLAAKNKTPCLPNGQFAVKRDENHLSTAPMVVAPKFKNE